MALSLGRAVAGTSVRAAQLNQIIDFLEGASGENISLFLRSAAGVDARILLSDNAGARSFRLLDSDEATIFQVDSNGNVTLSGTMSFAGGFVFPLSTVPAQTAEGSAVWDSDDDVLTVGDGAARKTFYPGRMGWTLVGANTAEVSTTSTVAVDLLTISGLSIPVGQPFKIILNVRKTATAANFVAFGLKINSTVVWEVPGNSLLSSTATVQAEEGYLEFTIFPRSANYLSGGMGMRVWRISSTGAPATGVALTSPAVTNLLPNATITSLTIRAVNDTANNNAAVKEAFVYVLGTAV